MSQNNDDDAVAGKIRAAYAMVRDISVSDGLQLAARFYDACGAALDDDPATAADKVSATYGDFRPLVPEMRGGLVYMSERCRALAGIFTDDKDPTRDVLEGRANIVDLMRGLRVLTLAHPNPDGREQCRSMANAIGRGLRSRVGLPVEVAPTLQVPEDIRRTLLVWAEMCLRANDVVKTLQRSGVHSAGGVAMVGRTGELRARLLVEFMRQGWGEMTVLIGLVGQPIGDLEGSA